jgi:hypothetical protein
MKKIALLLLSGLMLFLLYYFIIRPHEFEVNFKANTTPGDLIETIRIWDRSLDNASVLKADSFNTLKQTITRNDRRYEFNWHFTSAGDSTTKVNVQIAEPGRSFSNKLLVPFTQQAIETDAGAIVKEFYRVLQGHLNITSVKVVGETVLDPSFCACRSLETGQTEKANGMMKDFSVLTSFTDQFKLKLNGPPMVKIQQWSHSAGRLKFDFCFPITKTDSLPRVAEISYKTFKSERVLKAVYHGNYITSDRAWYALLQYAERNGYETNGLPIEYFYDNPTLGIKESEWKAEVFLPIKDQ